MNAPAIFLLNSSWSKIVPQKNRFDSDCEFKEKSESVFKFCRGTIFDQKKFKRKMMGALIKQHILQ
jgi:hypothetical protein